GGVTPAGNRIRTKYFGESGLVESAIASLATDRALLLLGVPGTGKSWLSEHLAAAISGCSTLLVQCTVGTDEQQLRYGWNYAQLLAKGPSYDALVETPLMRAMKKGQLLRLEELTRMNSEMQDQLITILSEKVLPIPELNELLYAQRGFNVIATSNTKDRGVNLMSSALKRRFNTVVLPLPDSIEKEQEIVQTRVAELGERLKLPPLPPLDEQLQQILTIFRELRRGESEDGTRKLKSPSGTLSTAEIIDLVVSSWSHAAYFGKGRIDARSLAPNIISTILKDPQKDRVVLLEYLEGVLRERPDFSPLYQSIKDAV
ncbi:MAG: AAA family ATPase, partial [Myxococcota bacterium]|nr:AAA family ATPase [Myxococcota bacterium]